MDVKGPVKRPGARIFLGAHLPPDISRRGTVHFCWTELGNMPVEGEDAVEMLLCARADGPSGR